MQSIGRDEVDVRLAYFPLPAVDNALSEAPVIRLAHTPGAQGDNVLTGQRGVDSLPPESKPAILVSFVYLPQFLQNQHKYMYRDWVMDSGAFSAYQSRVSIDLQQYIDTCKQLMTSDPTLVEVFALDVIGDWRASLRNTEEMWRQGVPAIPCFHAGEPWEALLQMARDYPKIALGGIALAKARLKDKWAAQCFARVYPKKIHGFGYGGEKSILALPWHSVDATNWELGPCKYGQWRSFKGQRVSVRGSKQNLRAEVEWYLDLEKRAREKWKHEMARLEAMTPTVPPSTAASSPNVRLAAAGTTEPGLPRAEWFEERKTDAPAVRLAIGAGKKKDTRYLTGLNPPEEKK